MYRVGQKNEAPLLYIINFSKLRFHVKNETISISAKNCVDLSSISEVRSYITEWPRFLAHPVGLRTTQYTTGYSLVTVQTSIHTFLVIATD